MGVFWFVYGLDSLGRIRNVSGYFLSSEAVPQTRRRIQNSQSFIGTL